MNRYFEFAGPFVRRRGSPRTDSTTAARKRERERDGSRRVEKQKYTRSEKECVYMYMYARAVIYTRAAVVREACALRGRHSSSSPRNQRRGYGERENNYM